MLTFSFFTDATSAMFVLWSMRSCAFKVIFICSRFMVPLTRLISDYTWNKHNCYTCAEPAQPAMPSLGIALHELDFFHQKILYLAVLCRPTTYFHSKTILHSFMDNILQPQGPFINTLVGGVWKVSILVCQNFFNPPLTIPETFLTPFQWYPKLF